MKYQHWRNFYKLKNDDDDDGTTTTATAWFQGWM